MPSSSSSDCRAIACLQAAVVRKKRNQYELRGGAGWVNVPR
jgi:hypothetical protein